MDAVGFLRVGLVACTLPLTAACAEGESALPTGITAGSGGEAGAANGGGSGGASGASGSSAGTGGASAAGSSGAMGAAGMTQAGTGGAGGNLARQEILPPFSFFVTSHAAMQRLANSDKGFGGDLRFGKADGLAGADEICRQIAERSMPGSSGKGWRAFLSVTKDASGKPVHAVDRIGAGPWYDRNGRLVAANKDNLIQPRPLGADPAIADDLPNEDGIPNHAPDGVPVDNHDVLTGTGADGRLYSYDPASTCRDWTSSVGADGRPRVGHSWPRMGASTTLGSGSMGNWMSALDEAGCAPGASLVELGPPDPATPTVGSGGGYGGIYCFALMP